MAENGSPRAVFETTDDRLTFLVTIPIHKGCTESSGTTVKSSETSSGTQSKSSETTEFSSERTTKSSERKQKSSERVLDLIRQKPSISAAEIAMKIDMSSRGVEKQIKRLREEGIIRRIGADFGGYWEIITKENK